VRPGIITKDAEGRVKCLPIYSRIVSLFAESNELQYAVPGGLIGVGLTVDPTLTRADRLVGQVRRGGGGRAAGQGWWGDTAHWCSRQGVGGRAAGMLVGMQVDAGACSEVV
jgi:hypothetical protein